MFFFLDCILVVISYVPSSSNTNMCVPELTFRVPVAGGGIRSVVPVTVMSPKGSTGTATKPPENAAARLD